MISGIESFTTRILGAAMDAATLRQQVIATNIANANTRGYVPLQVSFEARLEEFGAAIPAPDASGSSSLSGVRMSIQPLLDADGLPATVQLDQEVAAMAQNSLQFQALARGLTKHFSILASAASDGKR